MVDRITANLPSRDFAASSVFYARLGFDVTFRGDHWMILQRGLLVLEFFPFSDLDPRSSSFSACVRVDDLDTLLKEWTGVGLTSDPTAIPRLTG